LGGEDPGPVRASYFEPSGGTMEKKEEINKDRGSGLSEMGVKFLNIPKKAQVGEDKEVFGKDKKGACEMVYRPSQLMGKEDIY